MTDPTNDPRPRGRGGRPQDPDKAAHIIAAAIDLLSEGAVPTTDQIAQRAGVGKASIYRRWPTLDALLVDVVRELGVERVALPADGSLVSDLVAVVLAATTGPVAAAEVTVLSEVGRFGRLQAAYAAGPRAALYRELSNVEARSVARGEPGWPSFAPAAAVVRMLQHTAMTTHRQPNVFDVQGLVSDVAVPALTAPAVTA